MRRSCSLRRCGSRRVFLWRRRKPSEHLWTWTEGKAADLMNQSVEKCLEMCGLEAYADAIVGTLNVEFKKRTTIAVELVAKVRPRMCRK